MALPGSEYATIRLMVKRSGLPLIAAAAAYFAIWAINARSPIPLERLFLASFLATVAFVGLPIVGLYLGGRMQWKPTTSVCVLAGCLAVLGALLLAKIPPTPETTGIAQLARIGWPMALGFLVAGLVKDRNLLPPIAMVLATVDILAVFAPVGTVKIAMHSEKIRPIFDAVAIQVPKAGTALPMAQMGPADFLFLGMFFYAIFKFGMRAKETLYWVIPALAIYLSIVIFWGDKQLFGLPLGTLPALVPIGAAVVIANRDQFSMSKQEKAMTYAVLVLCLAVLVIAAILW
jgi:hypothetical protein